MLKRTTRKEYNSPYRKLERYVEHELCNIATFFANPHDVNLVGKRMDDSTRRILRYAKKMLYSKEVDND